MTQVMDFARKHQHPFQCVIEKEEEEEGRRRKKKEEVSEFNCTAARPNRSVICAHKALFYYSLRLQTHHY